MALSDTNNRSNSSTRLTWEILSRLSSSAQNSCQELSADNEAPIFFAQRSLPAGESVSSSTTSTDEKTSTRSPHDAALFFKACPVYTSCNDGSEGGGCGLSAVYSLECLKQEICRVLKQQYHASNGSTANDAMKQLHNKYGPQVGRRGRLSGSEIGTLFGMKVEDVQQLLCNTLISTPVQSVRSSKSDRKSCEKDVICQVYNPARRENEYALKEMLQYNLIELINWHCTGFDPPSLDNNNNGEEWCPSLEDMVGGSVRSNHYSDMGSITSLQLAQEMEMTHEDVLILLRDFLRETKKESIQEKDCRKSHIKQFHELHHDRFGLNCHIFAVMDNPGSSASASGKGIEFSNSQVMHRRINYLEEQLLSALAGVTVPTTLDSLSLNENHDNLIPIIESLCDKGKLRGTLSVSCACSGPSTTSLTPHATYTPLIYNFTQRKSLLRSMMNGYVTEKNWISLGLSRNRIEGYVKESFPSAVLLKNSIIDPNEICRPLEAAVQSAILNNTFADLRSLLPDDIASDDSDVHEIISNCLGTLLESQKPTHKAFASGLVVVDNDIGFFFTDDMVKQSKKTLVPLIEEFGKKRAKEIIDNENGDINQSTSGSCGSKKSKQKSNDDGSPDRSDIITFREVARSVSENYPDLLQVQQQFEDLHSRSIFGSNKHISWESDETRTKCSEGPLIAFCRHLFSDDLQHMCTRTVSAEVDRINATRHGISVSARTDGAAKVQDMEEAFEHSFKDLSLLLQVLHKSLETFIQRSVSETSSKNNDDANTISRNLKEELLMGCGSTLAARITQFCSFKNGFDMDADDCALFFHCHGDTNSKLSSRIPKFFENVDMSALVYPVISLRCEPDKDGNERRPLKYLQSIFPGHLGVALARMWSFCTGDAGVDEDQDGEPSQDSDRLNEFLSHLEDCCLHIVGIPFPVLDKKSEKRILSERRQGLLQVLDTSHVRMTLMAAVVLIYQLVRNITVSGQTTIDFVLIQFDREKKIPSVVGELLQKLKSDHDSPDPELLKTIKLLGSAKNTKALAAVADELNTL